jgi:sulfate transport system ATP-binding protein
MGSPVEVYHEAFSPFVYEFLGPANRFHGTMLARVLESAEYVQTAPGADIRSAELGFVRPHDFQIVPSESLSALRFRLENVRPLGEQVWLTVRAENQEVSVRVQLPWREWKKFSVSTGSDLWLRPRHIQIFRDPSVQDEWLGEGGHI